LSLYHSKRVLPETTTTTPTPTCPLKDPKAWDIIQDFAKGNDISLLETLSHLEHHFGDRYVYAGWKPAIDAVLTTEDNTLEALNALEVLHAKVNPPNKSTAVPHNETPPPPAAPAPIISQLTTFKTDLMESVAELHQWRQIVGTAPTLKDLLNLIQEREIGDLPYQFPGGDADIVAEVLKETNRSQQEAEEAVSDEEGEPEEARMLIWEVAELCERLEKVCVVHSDAHGVDILQLQGQLQKLCGHVRRLDTASLKQSSLNSFWGPVDVEMS
jgi:hypothetical protein